MKWAILSEELRSDVFRPIFELQKIAAITSVIPYTMLCLMISVLVIVFLRSITELSRANKRILLADDANDDDSPRILPDAVKERSWWFRDEITDVQISHNIMRGRLLGQYESLEERIRIKTSELHANMKVLRHTLSRVEKEKLNTQNALQVKEKAIATQERLVRSVAHDLKTPLNGILTPLESCKDHLIILLIRRVE